MRAETNCGLRPSCPDMWNPPAFSMALDAGVTKVYLVLFWLALSQTDQNRTPSIQNLANGGRTSIHKDWFCCAGIRAHSQSTCPNFSRGRRPPLVFRFRRGHFAGCERPDGRNNRIVDGQPKTVSRYGLRALRRDPAHRSGRHAALQTDPGGHALRRLRCGSRRMAHQVSSGLPACKCGSPWRAIRSPKTVPKMFKTSTMW